jgi:DNA topoisomerase II
MTWRPVTFNPGLYKIVDEIIVNAVDQSVIDPTLDKITIDVDPDFGTITVMNTGRGIPVEMIEEHGVWAPELIFGHLLTSSNYDDTEDRIVGGKNGLGAKLTNIYSLKFDLEIVDPRTSQKYRQTFENNMTKIGKPRITKCSSTAKGYVKITFMPDLSRFGLQRLDCDDNMAVIRRRAWDASACTGSKVKVVYNGDTVPIKTFESYVDLFVGGGKKDAPRAFFSTPDGRWDVVVAPAADGGFRQVSFVNGIATTKGGTHVGHVTGAIVNGLRALNAKKYGDVKPAYIHDHMFVFVRATLVNPSFSSQTKQECTSKVASFGSRFSAPEDFVKKVAKLGIMEEALALSKHREIRQMTKSDGAKTSTVRGIPKLEDAVRAGTKDSGRCTLIVCEGDSAKTFCISGLSVIGRDLWGVYPLRGKLLNVRDASPKQILDNQEIQQLKQILGLQQGRKYDTEADMATLRYGRVMILTDADLDGSHIKGLVINLFEVFWPSLVRRGGYLACMSTPVLKATSKKGRQNTMTFYTQKEFETWKASSPSFQTDAWSVKYYKGLGTSTAAEAKEYFGVVRDLTTGYAWNDPDDDGAVELAFKKQMANARKGWIVENTARPQTFERREPSVPLRDFINKELVHFSIADVVRSIPSLVDGLKPSQRKVLYGALKKASGSAEIKVSQLSGYVAEVSAYHHGEASLQGTIVNMAQDYVGSNNINLLVPSGQFGTRLQGGKDAASARYIFTRVAERTRTIFDRRDDPLLTSMDDDGCPIEPRFYVPTLPMVLINGAEGIGTGFSTSVPNYNPEDLKANIGRFLCDQPMVPMIPWYRGFKGTIQPVDDEGRSFRVVGTYVTKGTKELWITELPVGTWTQGYKEFLDQKFPNVKYENHSTETDVLFKLTFPSGPDRDAVLSGTTDPHKVLGLSSMVHTSNMYLFDPSGRITLYRSPLDILREYCIVRLEYYRRRKAHLLDALTKDTARLETKIRFVSAVIDGSLQIFHRPMEEVRRDMDIRMGFGPGEVVDELLETRVHEFTSDRVQRLREEALVRRREYEVLMTKEAQDLWQEDLGA